MALRSWSRVLLVSLGMAAVAGSGQLGLAYALGILRLGRTFAGESAPHWPGQLAWIAWIAALAAVLGALSGAATARRHRLALTTYGHAAVAALAGVGATAVAPLCMVPARAARLGSSLDPVLTVGLSAALGAIVGVVAAAAVLTHRVVAWNLSAVAVAAWLLALISVAPTLGAADPPGHVRLGLLDLPTLAPDTTRTMALVGLPALALAMAVATAGLARSFGLPQRAVALAGVGGPALLALAYLLGGPGGHPVQSAPYWGSLIGLAAGALGSLGIALLRHPEAEPAHPGAEPTHRPDPAGATAAATPERPGPEETTPPSDQTAGRRRWRRRRSRRPEAVDPPPPTVDEGPAPSENHVSRVKPATARNPATADNRATADSPTTTKNPTTTGDAATTKNPTTRGGPASGGRPTAAEAGAGGPDALDGRRPSSIGDPSHAAAVSVQTFWPDEPVPPQPGKPGRRRWLSKPGWASRPEKAERASRRDRQDRASRPGGAEPPPLGRHERESRPGDAEPAPQQPRARRAGKPRHAPQTDNPDDARRPDRSDSAAQSGKPVRSTRAGRPERIPEADGAAQPPQSGKPAQPPQSGKPAQPPQSGKPAQPAAPPGDSGPAGQRSGATDAGAPPPDAADSGGDGTAPRPGRFSRLRRGRRAEPMPTQRRPADDEYVDWVSGLSADGPPGGRPTARSRRPPAE